MKKTPLAILSLLLGIIIGAGSLLLFFRTANRQVVDTAIGTPAPETSLSPNAVTSCGLIGLAADAAEYIKTGDYNSLANIVHPTFGVVFSPSATVNLRANRCFLPSEVAKLGSNTASYVWGTPDGSNVPIELTVREYFKSYVYDYDYLNAQLVGVNAPVKTGNSLENVSETFPNAQFVDLCYPGTEENEYHDWSILRLVFEEYDGIFYLTAVIHSEYTI